MEESILVTIKKLLGIADDYEVFDLDIITHINTAFSTLTQLGIGPPEGFMIEDSSSTWDEVVSDDLQFSQVRTYVYLRVRQYFDPPTTRYTISSIDNQIAKFEWMMNVHREETQWVDPNPPEPVIP